MTAEVGEFIEFVAKVIVVLMIFMVVFTPEGIASNTFNYITYAEPILLQDWLSTAMTVGSNSEGEFVSSMQTSGNAYTINIYSREGIPYIEIGLPQEEYLKTKFAKVDPVPVPTNCKVLNQTIKLKKNLVQTLTVRKFINETYCVITVSTSGVTPAVTQQTPPTPSPTSCDCTDWTDIGPCGEAPCNLDELKFGRSCEPSGCDPGDGLGESKCVVDASCTLAFDFAINLNPDSGVVIKSSQISTNVTVNVVSGVRELISLSASGLPSDTTASFEFQSFMPPGRTKMTIATTDLTPKGVFSITITGQSASGLIRSAIYDLNVIETGGCCPHVTISSPSPINKGDNITISLTYTHTIPNGGGVHLHWLADKAKFISFDSSVSDKNYLPKTWNTTIMNGNDAVECGSETSRMLNGDTCNVTIKAVDSDIDLSYRAWDWTNDAICPSGSYDYDRDPISGTCSANCDKFSDDLIICDTYQASVPIIKNLHATANVGGAPSAANVVVIDKDFWRMGDINWDGKIDGKDNAIIADTFGSTCDNATCSVDKSCWSDYSGCTITGKWDPAADLNEDGKIEGRDMAIFGVNFGKLAPTYSTEFTVPVTPGKVVLYGTNPVIPTDIKREEVNVPPGTVVIDVNFDFASCICTAYSNSGCGSGGCAADEMYQTRTCAPVGCDKTSQCVVDTCTAYSNSGCGSGGCAASQMYQTRTCSLGCAATGRCVADTCTAWSNSACGGDACTAVQMHQTRTCAYDCLSESQCVADSCTAWSNVACAAGGCTAVQMYRIRTCNYDCLSETECTPDTYLADFWTNRSCGGNSCNLGQMWQTRTSQYNCLPNSQCVADFYTAPSWTSGGCYLQASPQCPTGQRRLTRPCAYGCLITSQCSWDSACCGSDAEFCVSSGCSSSFGGYVVTKNGCIAPNTICCHPGECTENYECCSSCGGSCPTGQYASCSGNKCSCNTVNPGGWLLCKLLCPV